MMTGLLVPLLIGVAGGGVDAASFLTHKNDLQQIADAAALAAANEASLNGWSTDGVVAAVNGFVQQHTGSNDGETVAAQVNVDSAQKQVEVTLAQDHSPYFVIGYFIGSPQIMVSSIALTNNDANICVIGLETSDSATVSLETNAAITAPKCAVYSNSLSTSGLVSTGNANLVSQLACSSGGFSGSARNYNFVAPITDCPAVTDPLVSRPPPTVGPCREQDAVYSHYIGNLQPGVYCGGLTIKASSDVTLRPGIFIIKDGPLIIESSSVVEGKGVGLFFKGTNANFTFASSSQVDLEAPISGPMAGLVAYQDRSSPETDFVITSNKARKLLGTIYLPNGNLIVDANEKVADGSAYTAIVAKRLRLSKGPNLVLNTDYNQTLVPVPEGIGPPGGQARLIH